MNFWCKFRHHRSIRRPRFPIRMQNFDDLATFSVDFLLFICWMSAIFLLPVCFTYWPRKYTTRVDPRVDNSHQVWSWYDHTLPSYSVFVCWYVSWPCDLDLWPFDLEQLSCMAGHVANPAFPIDYHWKYVSGHCACADSRDLWIGDQKQLHFWNPRPRFAYSLYNFCWATTTMSPLQAKI